MASVSLTDMLGAYTVTTDQLITAFQSAGIRCDAILGALAPYEASPNAVPTPITEYAGTYTLDTAAKRDAVLAAASPRGQSFMQAMQAYKV